MPGTEVPQPDAATPTDPDTGARLIDRLTLAGWLLLSGELGFILFQLQRVRTVDGTRFATAWSQRIEVLGFMMLPPNLIVLAPAVAIARKKLACVLTMPARPRKSPSANGWRRNVAAMMAAAISQLGQDLVLERHFLRW